MSLEEDDHPRFDDGIDDDELEENSMEKIADAVFPDTWFRRPGYKKRSWHKVKEERVKPTETELVAWCGWRWPVAVVELSVESDLDKTCRACAKEEAKFEEREKADAAMERRRIFTRSESTRFNE